MCRKLKKISSKLALIGRVREYLPLAHRSMLFDTLALPHFDYASVVWSNTDKSVLDSLVSLQARAGRIILGLPKRTLSDGVIGQMRWVPVRKRW